jgi:hypothetical protein
MGGGVGRAATSTPPQRPLVSSFVKMLGLKSSPLRRIDRGDLSVAAINSSSSGSDAIFISGAVVCVSILWQPTGPESCRSV